jgi:hypothetical protein
MQTSTSSRGPFLKRARAVFRAAVTLGIVLALLGAAASHPSGVLKISSKLLKAGDSLAVAGERFAPNDGVTIALVGVVGRVELGTVPTDSAGNFRRNFFVPASAKAGQYRLVAEAIDGDEVASVEVVVGAATDTMGPMPEGMSMESRPTGEPLQLTRARNRAVIWTASLFIIACAAAGAVLLRRPHAHPVEEQS